MNPGDIEKLLGGYATDTLTEEERSALFAAALNNQALFDALADEEALRELLEDPASRAHLLAALGESRPSVTARAFGWLLRPSGLALVGAIAAGIVLIAVVRPNRFQVEKPAAVAVNKAPLPPAETPAAAGGGEKQDAPAPAASSAPAKPRAAAPPQAGPSSGKPETRSADTGKKQTEHETRREEKTAMAESTPPPPPKQEPAPALAPPLPASPAPARQDFVPPAGAVQQQSQGGQAQSTSQQIQVQAQAPPVQQSPAPTQQQPKFQAAQPLARPKEADSTRVQTEAVQVRPPAAKSASPASNVANAPNARDLYYSASPAGGAGGDRMRAAKAKRAAPAGGFTMGRVASRPPAAPAGVRYSILKRNPDGSFVEVDPSAGIAPGSAIRVRFETNQAGSLNVMERQSGNWTPRLAVAMRTGEPVYLPVDGTLTVPASGERHFFVKFTRGPVVEALKDQLSATPDVVKEKVANSVYLVNARVPEPTLDFELTINTAANAR
jgi:hypothetical protein